MNQQGFTLIEVLVALAIAAFMTTALFTALYQINKGTTVTDSLMTVHEKAARLQQLLEHDLSGATMLLDNEPLSQEQTTQDAPTQEKDKPDNKKESPEKTTEKKEKKIVKKIFYSTGKDNGLGTLSFISNNPLLGFWSGQEGAFHAGKAKPCLVRTTYMLENDESMPGSYKLIRQESIPLYFEQRAGRSYEVMSGIKNVAFKYTLKTIKTKPEQQPQKDTAKTDAAKKTPDKEPQKAQQPQEEITYTSNISTWDSDEIIQENAKKEKDKEKEKKVPIPIFVDIEVTLWDDTYEHEYTYDYSIELIADTQFIAKRRQWAIQSLFQQPETPKELPQKDPQQPQKVVIPTQGPQIGYAQGNQNSELQKRLNELFKTVKKLDQGISV